MVGEKAGQALNRGSRHMMRHMNKAIDKGRATEATNCSCWGKKAAVVLAEEITSSDGDFTKPEGKEVKWFRQRFREHQTTRGNFM